MTGKPDVLHANGNPTKVGRGFKEAYGLMSQAVNAEKIIGEAEPTESDLAAALWKLRVGQMSDIPAGGILMVISSDVEYRGMDDKQRLKISRYQDHPEFEAVVAKAREAVIAEWEQVEGDQNITVEWLLSFGFQLFWKDHEDQLQSSDRQVIRLVIQAEFSTPPTKAEIEESFNINFNTGFELAELATDDRAIVRVANYIEGHRVWKEIPHDFLIMMITNKVIPPQLLSQLAFNFSIEGQKRRDRKGYGGYQQVAVSLLGLN